MGPEKKQDFNNELGNCYVGSTVTSQQEASEP